MKATEQAAKGGTSSFEDLAAMVGLSKEEFKDLTDEMAGTIASFVDFGGAYSDVLQRKQDARRSPPRRPRRLPVTPPGRGRPRRTTSR